MHLVQGHQLYGDDVAAGDATYNNVHPTDLGHWRIADFYSKYLPLLLAGQYPAALRPRQTQNKGLVQNKGSVSQGQTPNPNVAAAVGQLWRRPLQPHMGQTAPLATEWTNFTALEITGRAFNDTPTPFNRLPVAAKATVRPAVWDLGLNAAGLSVRFESNAGSIEIKYTLGEAAGVGMPHFPASGISGADLYALDESVTPSVWKFVGTRQNLQKVRSPANQLKKDLRDRVTSHGVGTKLGRYQGMN